MNVENIKSQIQENGELMAKVEEIEEPVELHLHDTRFEDNMVVVDLADGELRFTADRVAATWKHYHSIEDYGLDD
ncbi:hypothetical protein K0C01_10025 [Salinarchaeum sp. IM2453]|uniref:hypothetical protein n=1 Tax=Salinarchaeum sp. IM2453 TaxID=2862870 RepID=UPI001C82A2C5|nr:hypothetical protein [Salinarchaeum sp. IM2453]QZA88125.1 hypothetical protein K0C01_10025 [Salinarchaeum sp. IM2453]